MVIKGLTVKATFEQRLEIGELMNPYRHLQEDCSKQYVQSLRSSVSTMSNMKKAGVAGAFCGE